MSQAAVDDAAGIDRSFHSEAETDRHSVSVDCPTTSPRFLA